jgi:hypothetical protein
LLPCSCKSALGSDGLKIARRLLLVLCCAAATSGHATATHTTLRKARRLMSTPSLGQGILTAKTGTLETKGSLAMSMWDQKLTS